MKKKSGITESAATKALIWSLWRNRRLNHADVLYVATHIVPEYIKSVWNMYKDCKRLNYTHKFHSSPV